MGALLKFKPIKTNHSITPEASGNERLATRVFTAVFLVSLYYLSYRYPFQINSSESSPTYSDTPAWLQVGKYAILIGVLLIAAIVGGVRGRFLPSMGSDAVVWPRLAFLLFSGFAFTKGLTIGSTDMVILGLTVGAGFILSGLASKWGIDSSKLTQVISFFTITAVIVEIVQVMLFLIQGRLPALAYANTLSVRFGSLLDDPNGFGILIALMLPIVLVSWTGHQFWRVLFFLCLVGCLILTQSFTAFIAVLSSFVVGYLALYWRKPIVSACFLIVAPGALLLFGNYLSNSTLVQQLLLTKNGSVEGHRQSLDVLQSMGFVDLAGFGEPTTFIESSYVSLISSVGLPLTVVYFSLGILAVFRLYRTITQAGSLSEVSFQFGMYFYLIAYIVGSINMQFSQVFPLDLIYIVGICFSLFRSTNLVLVHHSMAR